MRRRYLPELDFFLHARERGQDVARLLNGQAFNQAVVSLERLPAHRRAQVVDDDLVVRAWHEEVLRVLVESTESVALEQTLHRRRRELLAELPDLRLVRVERPANQSELLHQDLAPQDDVGVEVCFAELDHVLRDVDDVVGHELGDFWIRDHLVEQVEHELDVQLSQELQQLEDVDSDASPHFVALLPQVRDEVFELFGRGQVFLQQQGAVDVGRVLAVVLLEGQAVVEREVRDAVEELADELLVVAHADGGEGLEAYLDDGDDEEGVRHADLDPGSERATRSAGRACG